MEHFYPIPIINRFNLKTVLFTLLFLITSIIGFAQSEEYCTPTYSTGCSMGDQISNVNLIGLSQTLDNTSECSEAAYGDFTDLTPADLAPGATYSISVTTDYTSPISEQVNIWIDYNQDFTFSDDEKIATTAGEGMGNGTVSFDFTLPTDVTAGDYRMRVRLVYSYGSADYNACDQENYGETEDYTVSVVQLDDCTGTPVAGTPEVTELAICANSPFSLSVSGSSAPANGLTRTWQSSPAGQNSWTDIAESISTQLTLDNGITEATDYRYKVVCTLTNEEAISDVISVSLNPATECYCTPIYSSGCGSGDRISNVSLTGISQGLDNSTECSDNAYGDFTDLTPADLGPGLTYTITVSTDNTYPNSDQVNIWIDYNNNGTFETSEQIATTAGDGMPDGLVNFDFTLPQDVEVGEYRMRVRLVRNYSNADFDACEEVSYGETEDYTISVIQLDDCTGTPTVGTPETTNFSVCANDTFSLTITGAELAANGLTHIWQSSPADQDNWTDIEGAISTDYTITDGITEATDYRYKVVCTLTNEEAVSDVIAVALNPADECYCIPTYSTGCSAGDRISNVTLNGLSTTINNDSECSENAYGDFTSLTPADLAPGSQYTLSVSTDYGSPSSENVRAWIDYNGNGTFEDTEEIIYTDGNGMPDGTYTENFIVPDTAASGNYRMRVRLVYGSSDIVSCANATYGEAEDYTVSIIQLDDCTGTPSAGSIESSAFAVCASDPFTVSVTGSSAPANGLERTWQSSPAGQDNWTDIEGSISPSFVLQEGISEATDFRYKMTCTSSGETSYSDIIAVTLNPATECYCTPSSSDTNSTYISNFSTDGGLVDIHNDSQSSDTGYSDYTTDTITVYPGQNIEASITFTTSASNVAMWIDWNKNGSFDDEGENTITANNVSTPFNQDFVIPDTAEIGTSTRIRVRNVWYGEISPCEEEFSGEAEDYILKIVALPDCLPPSDLSTNNLTSSSVDITWTPGGAETQWEVIYGEAGFDQYTGGTTLTVDTDPSTSISGLTENTTYEVYARALCSDTDSSLLYGPLTFTTNCISTDIPFNQDFEATTPPLVPDCATLENINTTKSWETLNISENFNDFGFTGNVLSFYTGSGISDNWYMTQGINLESGVNYKIKYRYSNGSTYNTGKLKIAYGTSSTAEGMTNTLKDYPDMSIAESVLDSTVFTVPESGVYYFGFQAYSEPYQGSLYIDDINIDLGPTCAAPTNVSFQYITDVSVQVDWTAGANDTAWEVAYGPLGFDPNQEGTIVQVNSDEPTTVLTGLTQQTAYEVYVRAICGENSTSYWSEPNNFTTNITPPVNTYLCDAIELVINDACAGPYTNVAAFEQPDEPVGNCLNNFHGTNSVWFKFVAPANGLTTISTDYPETEFNTEMVVFSAPSDCEDVTSLGNQIACAVSGQFEISLSDLAPDDVYYVKVAGFNQAQGEFCITVTSDLSVDKQQFEGFTFYPNPVENKLNLQAQTSIEQVAIYNMLGQQVLLAKPNTLDAQLNTSNLESGVYFMQVQINGVEKHFKLIKK